MGRPIIPRNKSAPIGIRSIEIEAEAEFRRKISTVIKFYIEMLNEIEAEPISNAKYKFRTNGGLFRKLLNKGSKFIDEVFLATNWLFDKYIYSSYNRGTQQEIDNIKAQSTEYMADDPSLVKRLKEHVYKRRLAMIASRQFELMKGYTAQMKSDLAGILASGIAKGDNPLKIAKDIRAINDVSITRANRIARTEIAQNLRQARMDETKRASEKYGIKFKQLHISALSPTTRPSHAARHGKLFTIDEQEQWWSEGANAINCKCTTVSVMVNDKGETIIPLNVLLNRK